MSKAFNDLASLADKATNECIRLRSRLVDAVALLNEVSNEGQDIGGNIELFDRISAFLRATDSAEPVQWRCGLCKDRGWYDTLGDGMRQCGCDAGHRHAVTVSTGDQPTPVKDAP